MLANSDFFCFSSRPLFRQRAVAQSGSVLAWGARGRGFESRQPDHCLGANVQANPHLAVFVKFVWIPKMLSWIAEFGIEQLPARLRMFPEIGGACDSSSLVPT